MKYLKIFFKFVVNEVTLEFSFEESSKTLQQMTDFREAMRQAMDALDKEIVERQSNL